MTRTNAIVLAIFFGAMAAFIAAAVAWDVWLAATAPDAVNTISWGMARLGRCPIAVFAVGHGTGGILWGLAAHFWAPQPTPAMWDDYLRLKVLEEEWKRHKEAELS